MSRLKLPMRHLPRQISGFAGLTLEYRARYGAAAIDARALRKAAQRVHDLEQVRAVLARELR